MSENQRGGDLLLGVVIGAAVGAAIALLLAPAKGAETRRRLAEAARGWGDEARDELEKVRETISKRVG